MSPLLIIRMQGCVHDAGGYGIKMDGGAIARRVTRGVPSMSMTCDGAESAAPVETNRLARTALIVLRVLPKLFSEVQYSPGLHHRVRERKSLVH
jgi:hypothetical protein